MKSYHFSTLFISAILLTGCATTSQFRKVTLEEAFSFERARMVESTTPQQESKPLYVQPLNKTEPCKLPTSQDQLDRNNFRAYWDGECRGGFAYGLGRDIAISDTHHVEEITIYGDSGEKVDSPSVYYDFVHQDVAYRFIREDPSRMTNFIEHISTEQGNFEVWYELGEYSENGDAKIIQWSPFGSSRLLFNASGNVVYRYTVNENLPDNSTDPVFLSETLDSNSGVSGGFAVARYANGQVRHYKVSNGQPEELVELPQEYISKMVMKYQEIEKAQAQASSDAEKAKRMEKEYLYLACNDKHEISGLEKEVSSKICTWREQFQEPFRLAQKKYYENLERMKVEARSANEQRKIQDQIDYQKRMVQAAERQAAAAEKSANEASWNNYQQQINNNKNCYRMMDGSYFCY